MSIYKMFIGMKTDINEKAGNKSRLNVRKIDKGKVNRCPL